MKLNKKLVVEINGFPQKIHLWGQKMDNPIILFVHGGPGNPFRHKIRKYFLSLTDSYILAAYDQRGTGGSYRKIDPKTLDPFSYVIDVVEWAKYLTKRFNQKQVYIVGESWGSFIGTLACLYDPSLFKGYIGFGQVVDMKESMSIQYQMTLEAAKKRKDEKSLSILKEIGEPHHGSFKNKNDDDRFFPLMYRNLEDPNLPSYTKREIHPFYFSIEYSIKDKIGWAKGKYLLDAAMPYWKTVYPSIYEFKEYPLNFQMPYYAFQGEKDFITPYRQVEDYFTKLTAPIKELVPFPGCGHESAFENPEKFKKELRARFK